MLSYVSEKAKPTQISEESQSSEFKTPITQQQFEKNTADQAKASTQESNFTLPTINTIAFEDSGTTKQMGSSSFDNTSAKAPNNTVLYAPTPTKTTTNTVLYKLDTDGQIYEDLTEEIIEEWLWEGRLVRTDKICRANGQWFEIHTVPKFRRVIEQLEAQAKENQAYKTKPTPQPAIDNTAFLTKMAIATSIVLAIYITVNLVFQYYLYVCVSDDTYTTLILPKANINLIRPKIQERLKDRSLYIPDENIAVNANFEKQEVSVSVNYKKSIFLIPIRYKVERQTNTKITMDQLIQLKKEDQIQLAGVTEDQIEAYRKKKAEEEAEKAKSNPYSGDERPLNERDKLILELQKGEFGILPSQNLIKQAVRAQQQK
jgi:hypothetical protein